MSRLFDGEPKMRLAGFALGCLLLVGANATASTFSPPQVYPAAPWPSGLPDAVAVGDFNADGREDVVLATTMTAQGSNPDDHTLFIFLQGNSGQLAQPLKIKYSSLAEEGNDMIGYKRLTAVAAADFNGDGIDDIVAGRRFGLSLVLGRRDAAFSVKRVECTSGACGPDSMAVTDVDRDGHLDLLAHNEWGTSFGLTVYFGDGGVFTRQRLLPTRSDGGVNVRIGDLNSDGRDDVVISWLQGLDSGAEIFLADGTGWFHPGKYVPRHPDVINTRALAVGEFDGDHLVDIAMGGASYAFDGRGFYLHKQLGDGSFQSPIPLPAAAPTDDANVPDKAVVADFSGDGRDDVVVLRSGGDIGYFEQGPAGLKPEIIVDGPYATWADAHGIAAGDVNKDGCLDVVTANYNYGLVVFRGTGCLLRLRANGSHPLVGGGWASPIPASAQDSSGSADLSSDGTGGSGYPSRTRPNQPSDNGGAGRFASWLRVVLALSFLGIVWWRWWH